LVRFAWLATALHRIIAAHNDRVGRKSEQLGRIIANYRGCTVGPAGFDPYVLTIDPTQLLQRLNKSCVVGARFRVIHGHKYSNPPHPLALLGSRRQRPSRSSAGQRDEAASPHSCPPEAQNKAS
jgi:hypothetical protein